MQNKKISKADLLSIATFPVQLTYTFVDPPLSILLKCKIAMSDDDRAARQAFYSKPAGDIEAGLFAYHVDMLSRIVEGVEGLPGFDETRRPENTEAGTKRLTMAESIKEYFAEGGPILQKIAADALDRYNVISQPAEFFR